ncbi:MAG: hypothetical protein AAGH53_03790 [Pseudomonadota bacterium]
MASFPASAQQKPPQQAPAAQAEIASAMVPVNALFAAIASRDTSGISEHIQDGATMTITRSGEQTSRRITFQQWATQISGATDEYEEIMPDLLVRIDGNIAMVWGFYTFTRNGALSHCGVNHIGLLKENGVWKISNLAFSVRTEQCEVQS